MATQYEVRVSPAAKAGLDVLPRRVAAATLNFMKIYLQQQPHEAGVELRGGQLKGCFIASRGQYRIVYKIDIPAGVVDVLQILPQH
jgi:mRNA-degrading endonuclease RelE of RelBE toxin-antitoxin system